MYSNIEQPELQERYKRQIALPEIGNEGQTTLSEKKVLIVGAGGLGSPLLYYLVAAGVGEIRIVDNDTVNLSNLQRQILYSENDLGCHKATKAQERVSALNRHSTVVAFNERFNETTGIEMANGVDLIIDACDNLSSRYAMDRVSQQLNIPYLYGAVEGFQGQMALFEPSGTVRYHDLFPTYSPEREQQEIAVLGGVAGWMGSMMAVEAIKCLLHLRGKISNELLLCDALSWQIQRIALG